MSRKGFGNGVCGIMALALLLSTAVMAATPKSAVPDGGTDKGLEKDSVSTPLMEYGYGGLTSLASSPDGTKFLTGSQDGRVRLWDIGTGTVIRTFTRHTANVTCVAFSPDGTKVLSGAGFRDNTARLWDAATGAELLTFSGHTDHVSSVAFSPDGARVLTGSYDSTVKLWDAATGTELRTFTGHTGLVTCATFSPDGTKVLSGADSPDNTVKLWDTATGTELRTFTGLTSGVNAAVFSPDGTKVLGGADSPDNTAKLWDMATGTVLDTFAGHTSSVLSVAFSPDGTRVLTGSANDTSRLWETATGDEVLSLPAAARAVAFLPDGSKIISAGGNVVRLWDASNGGLIRSFLGHTGTMFSAVLSPDGTRVLSGTGGGAFLWDTATGALIRTFARGEIVLAVAFSPDGAKIFAGLSTASQVWDTETGTVIRTFSEGTNSAAFSPDGASVLTASGYRAKLWDFGTGILLQSYIGHDERVSSVAFSPDGTKVFTGSMDSSSNLWDKETGAIIHTFQGRAGWGVKAVAFSPDGTKVLTGTEGKYELNPEGGGARYFCSSIIWNALSGEKLGGQWILDDEVTAVAFSPDSIKTAVGLQYSATARMVDPQRFLGTRIFSGHAMGVVSVAFSPDGTKVLTGSGEGIARLWDAVIPPDTTPPILTINQASTQADPTSKSPLNFTVSSSEELDWNCFMVDDVLVSGSAEGVKKVVLTNPRLYMWNVAISGMTSSGTVTVEIPAGAVKDHEGNFNTVSAISTDSTVTYFMPEMPLLSNIGLGALAAILGLGGVVQKRRRRQACQK